MNKNKPQHVFCQIDHGAYVCVLGHEHAGNCQTISRRMPVGTPAQKKSQAILDYAKANGIKVQELK